MAVYEVNYYPVIGRYDSYIIESRSLLSDMDTIYSSNENGIVHKIYVEAATFAEAVAKASGKFLEAKVGCNNSLEEETCCCSDKHEDFKTLLVLLIDYFRGTEPSAEIAKDLEVMLDDL